MANFIYINCDMDVGYSGANLESTGAYLNAGTCTYALKTNAGVLVPGGTGTLDYVAASNGNYLGTIDSTITALLSEGSTYRLEITFVQANANDFRRDYYQAAYRKST